MEKIRGVVQNYAWGCVGNQSLAAKIASLNLSQPLEEEKPTAELWFGCHSQGMAVVESSGISLSEHISQNSSLYSNHKSLSFLMKILSAAKPLSIQAHPDKSWAVKLHQQNPSMYKDDNHKPESLLVLSDTFEGLCGFRSPTDIFKDLSSIRNHFPKLFNEVFPDETFLALDSHPGALQENFAALMTAPAENVAHLIEALIENDVDIPKRSLLSLLNSHFPNDRGVLCAYFMHHNVLKKGEVMWISPRTPHSYICGEGVEIMALSDNVLRAGLTPKKLDIPNVLALLDYSCSSDVSKFRLYGEEISPGVVKYQPPEIDDFAYYNLNLIQGPFEFQISTSPQLALVLSGRISINGCEFTEGQCVLLQPNQAYSFISITPNAHVVVCFSQ